MICKKIDLKKGMSVLDIGCGNGKLCKVIAEESGAYTAGIDRDRNGIEIAKKAYPDLSFFQFGVEDDPQLLLNKVEKSFDLVVLANGINSRRLSLSGFKYRLPKTKTMITKKLLKEIPS